MPSSSKRPPIGRALLTAGALVAAALTPIFAVPAASAAVPQTVLFETKFENTGTRPVLLTNYSSVTAGGATITYTADPGWLRACNGIIVAGNSSPDDLGLTNCNARPPGDSGNARAYQSLRHLANALGQYRSNPAPETNHALAAFTDGANPGAGVQLRSSVIDIGGAENRYVALSVDGAALNCQFGGPDYRFSIINGATNAPTQLGSAALCTDPGAVDITAPSLEGSAPRIARVATVDSAVATKFTGSTIRAVIENVNGSGSGNDAAVDNIRIVDVTPTLEKSFSSPTNTEGDTVGVVFKINNTEELLAKDGWDFTDTLPAGMTVANPALAVACFGPTGAAVVPSAVTTTAVAGGKTIGITGGIPQGAENCTVTIQVRAGATPGSYTNGPSNLTGNFLNVGEFPPATTTFANPADAAESTPTPFNTPVTVNPFTNFAPVPGDGTPTTANRNTFLFSNGQTTMATPEGNWSYDAATGLITFAPANGYVGTTPAMPYSYRDSNGNLVSSTATVIVGGDIIDLARSGDQGQPVTVPLTGQTADIDPTSVRIFDPATNAPVAGPVVVADEGTWTVSAAGTFTFTPQAGFQGDPTPIRYTATDGTGAQVAPAIVTVTYPNVSNVAGSGAQGQPVTVPANLDEGVIPATVQLIDPATGNPTTAPVVVEDQGTWTVNAEGGITFTPQESFTGDPTPIQYVAADGAGNLALPATVAIDYPNVSDVADSGAQGQPVTVPANLDEGVVPATVQLIDPATGNPTTAPVVVEGEGTWTVNAEGDITFTPQEGFTGDPTPIQYVAADGAGNLALPATVAIDYPNVSDVTGAGEQGQPVTVPANLDEGVIPATVQLIDPATGNPTTAPVVVEGEGTWTVTAEGDITFTPEAGFTGDPTPIEYTAEDGAGNLALPATVAIDYPNVSDVAGSGAQGQPVTVPADLDEGMDPATVQLIDPATGNPTTNPVVVTGQGTWTVNGEGDITFTPEADFGGDPTPIEYTAEDGAGNLALPATVAIDYPNVSDVTGAGAQGQPVTVPANLDEGVVPATVQLIDPATGNPTTTPVVVAGEGTWSVTAEGDITFTPEAGFTGDPTPIEYTAEDGAGNLALPATVAIDYPNVSDVAGSGAQGQPVTVPADLDEGMDPATVQLIDPATGNPTTNPVVVTGQGTWTVNGEGDITFTPEAGFTGNPTPIQYIAEDGEGNRSLPATVTITYAAGPVVPPAPTTVPTDNGNPKNDADLADTGSTMPMAIGMLAFLLMGSGLVLALRSRRGARQS